MKSLASREKHPERQRLGEILRKARAEKAISLSDLAEMTGLSKSYLGELETGSKGVNMPMRTVALLAGALDLSPALIASTMEPETAIDARKYGEHYRVLRSNVRAGRVAALLKSIRGHCKRAKEASIAGKDVLKILQDIEKTVKAVDNTLAYRGKPPVSVRPAADTGDDDKFKDFDLGKLG